MSGSIYQYSDYRVFIQECLKDNTPGFKFSKTQLAEAARVKLPYISKCLSGSADLSQDQAHLIAVFLKLRDDELDYFLLLVDYSKSYVSEYKKHLAQKIQKIQKFQLKTEKTLKINEVPHEVLTNYYLDPLNLILHMCFFLDQRPSISQLSNELNVSEIRLKQKIQNLIEMGILKQDGDQITSAMKGLHLPSSSHLCMPHQALMRQKIINFQDQISHVHKGYNTMFTFTADNESFLKIKSLFLEFLKKADGLISQADSNGVYQMQFDLFPWFNPEQE
ncbi:MAG: TIGR02147 family protein [Bacteriovoracaceae bacterium]|nr:TIGR02147 family protein [Bacteriovoracaceae bacterium]